MDTFEIMPLNPKATSYPIPPVEPTPWLIVGDVVKLKDITIDNSVKILHIGEPIPSKEGSPGVVFIIIKGGSVGLGVGSVGICHASDIDRKKISEPLKVGDFVVLDEHHEDNEPYCDDCERVTIVYIHDDQAAFIFSSGSRKGEMDITDISNLRKIED
jgi:hypothetical protein